MHATQTLGQTLVVAVSMLCAVQGAWLGGDRDAGTKDGSAVAARDVMAIGAASHGALVQSMLPTSSAPMPSLTPDAAGSSSSSSSSSDDEPSATPTSSPSSEASPTNNDDSSSSSPTASPPDSASSPSPTPTSPASNASPTSPADNGSSSSSSSSSSSAAGPSPTAGHTSPAGGSGGGGGGSSSSSTSSTSSPGHIASGGGSGGSKGSSTSSTKAPASFTTWTPVVSTEVAVVTKTNSDGATVVQTTTTKTTHSAAVVVQGDSNPKPSGLSTKTRNTVIGVVVGIGGAIVLGALGLVAFRIWGRKKHAEEADGLMDYNTELNSHEKVERGGSPSNLPPAPRNPFQSTLENYHQPVPVNASSNF